MSLDHLRFSQARLAVLADQYDIIGQQFFEDGQVWPQLRLSQALFLGGDLDLNRGHQFIRQRPEKRPRRHFRCYSKFQSG
jgi:hypothetical protein